MINTSEFAERLRKIMDHYQLTSSAFADKVQVQRSSISHLLSGRNKPSLDFVMKVVKTFDQVELYWLLNGKGVFPTQAAISESEPSASAHPRQHVPVSPAEQLNFESLSGPVERIVIFFKDGTFKEYRQKV